MKLIQRQFPEIGREDEIKLIPIGDTHLGAAACNEDRLKYTVEQIKNNDNYYWIGLGDYLDCINRSDPRFDPVALADWLTIADLVDLGKAQRDYFLDIISPVAHKCLALIEGNHEEKFTKFYERAVYFEIATAIKEMGEHPPEHNLALGYNGYLILSFYRDKKKKGGASHIKVNLHHGFGGGRLAGGRALNMQRWLWTHDCDLCLMGHNHHSEVIPVAWERVITSRKMRVETTNRLGAYTGSYLKYYIEDGESTYGEKKGYLPVPQINSIVTLRPGAENHQDRIQISVGTV